MNRFGAHMAGHELYVPPPPLSTYVDHFWLLTNLEAPARQMIVPDGGLELILNLGDPQRVHDRTHPSKFDAHRDAWIRQAFDAAG